MFYSSACKGKIPNHICTDTLVIFPHFQLIESPIGSLVDFDGVNFVVNLKIFLHFLQVFVTLARCSIVLLARERFQTTCAQTHSSSFPDVSAISSKIKGTHIFLFVMIHSNGLICSNGKLLQSVSQLFEDLKDAYSAPHKISFLRQSCFMASCKANGASPDATSGHVRPKSMSSDGTHNFCLFVTS